MLSLLSLVIIEQAAHRGGVFFPRLIAVDQHMPRDAHPTGKLNQRLKAGLSKLNHLNPFSIKVVSALAGQLADGPGLGLPLHQQPAAGKQ